MTFLLQMSGWNGSGKSTLARSVARATGAVVLDHDTTKTAILEAGAFLTRRRVARRTARSFTSSAIFSIRVTR